MVLIGSCPSLIKAYLDTSLYIYIYIYIYIYKEKMFIASNLIVVGNCAWD
jgi:hypothetical protein